MKPLKLKYKNYEDLAHAIESKDPQVVIAMVETALEHMKSDEERIYFLYATVLKDEVIFEFSMGKEDLEAVFESNLPDLEKQEEYELCIKVKEALEILKSNNE
jgi:hypothetical protein|tara:strand:+ start:548 stop:856 length:309 start_codon:yes stop_codon:yes gene_type:complete